MQLKIYMDSIKKKKNKKIHTNLVITSTNNNYINSHCRKVNLYTA